MVFQNGFFCCEIGVLSDTMKHNLIFLCKGFNMTAADMDVNANCVLDLSEEQKIAFLRAFSKMAGIDGNFDESEKHFIKNIAISFGVTSDKTEEILDVSDEDKIIEEVAKIKNRRVALELVKELCMLAHADDELSDEETLFIGKVGLAMGVELEKIEQISNWVIDRLIWLDQGKIIFEEV